MEVDGHCTYFSHCLDCRTLPEFYRELLPFLGLKPVIDTETTYYSSVAAPADGISAPSAEHEGAAFDGGARQVGLHHLCFRARERARRQRTARFSDDARRNGDPRAARGSVGKRQGYYSILFEPPMASGSSSITCRGRGLSASCARCVDG